MRSLLLLLLFVGACLAKKNFHGYQVLRTSPLDLNQADFLRQLQLNNHDLDFWKESQPRKSAEIMAGPLRLKSLKNLLTDLGIGFTVKIEDVQQLIESNAAKAAAAAAAAVRVPSEGEPRYNMNWNAYFQHDDINQFIDELADTFDFVNTVSIGETFEKRDMRVIQIAKAGPGAPNVWVEAGIHAREWISPAVATYIIRELVENYTAHPEYVDKINIHILPVTNPDGYEYTFSDDRLWRKTRSDTGSAVGCMGVDSNRNYDYHWGESGVSNNSCSDTYPGSGPFSEIENQNVRDYVLALDPKPIYANALHSAAELWLYPYGWAYDTYPSNVDEQIELGDAAVAAIYETHGVTFVCEHSAELYPASGDSNDWYTGVVGARFAYTTELRDQGYGFILPEDQIIPSGEEMWAAYEVVLKKIIQLTEAP